MIIQWLKRIYGMEVLFAETCLESFGEWEGKVYSPRSHRHNIAKNKRPEPGPLRKPSGLRRLQAQVQGPEPPCLCVRSLSRCGARHSACSPSPDSGDQQKMPEGANASMQPCMLLSALFRGETTSPNHPLFRASPLELLTGLVGPSATPTTPSNAPPPA